MEQLDRTASSQTSGTDLWYGLFAVFVCLSCIAAPLRAQDDRIGAPVESSIRTTLSGTVHPKVTTQNEIGFADPLRRLDYVSLLLKKTPAQQNALERLLEQQLDSSSPNYHRWLTPEGYADRFGVSLNDLAKIAAWLGTQGFKIEATARGRDWIAFSGTVSQAAAAFHTEFHRYRVDGEDHFGNATELVVPESLANFIEGIRGFNDFLPRRIGKLPASLPQFTNGNGTHALVPDDLAAIYNISPLYRAGFDGTGQRLAVVGQSAIVLSDIRQFRATFGLSSRDPEIWPIGSPGITTDQSEANLDVEWSGAVARNATIVYDYATSVYSAVQDVIDN
jgi:subtilase family serine protease